MKSSAKSLVVIIIILSAISAKAQKIRFGVFADPQLSWFTSDTKKFTPNGSVFGFNAGFTLEKYFAERYAITTGASINSIGGNLKYNDDGYTLQTRDSTYNIDPGTNIMAKGQYISVPLGLKFKTNEIGYFTFYAHLGVNGNFRLKGYAWEDSNNIEKEVLTNEQLSFAFVSYYFGGGMEYSLGGPSALQVGAIFSNGFTPTYEAGYGKVSVGGLALRIGIAF